MEKEKQRLELPDWLENLRQHACRILRCHDYVAKESLRTIQFDSEPEVVKVSDNLEIFQYDGYTVEVHLLEDRLAMQVYLKGECVLNGWFSQRDDWFWNYGHKAAPAWKTRHYLKEWAYKRTVLLAKQTQPTSQKDKDEQ